MSESQAIWTILWKHAVESPEPCEASDVAPDVAKAIGVSVPEARKRVAGFVKELERLPDGKQFFSLEGEAVVPQPEFRSSAHDDATVQTLYPFED
jgi:hypothetical protein